MKTKETRKNIIRAGQKAVNELIKVAEEQIITDSSDDLAADRLKNAAATKKLCIMDAFEILQRIEEEESILNGEDKTKEVKSFKGLQKGEVNDLPTNSL